MKSLFYQGGPQFMSVLTILLIITTAWFIYHFMISYHSKKINQEKLLRLFAYGKSMGLLALITGILGANGRIYCYVFSNRRSNKKWRRSCPGSGLWRNKSYNDLYNLRDTYLSIFISIMVYCKCIG